MKNERKKISQLTQISYLFLNLEQCVLEEKSEIGLLRYIDPSDFILFGLLRIMTTTIYTINYHEYDIICHVNVMINKFFGSLDACVGL